MSEKKDHSVNEIKKSLENLLNVKTSLKLKRTSKEDKEFEKFEKLINTLEELDVRSFILEKDLHINLNEYDKKFYSVIDSLLEMKYGPEISELIYVYLYERKIGENQSFNLLNSEGKVVAPLNNIVDLWNLVLIIKESNKKKKKDE